MKATILCIPRSGCFYTFQTESSLFQSFHDGLLKSVCHLPRDVIHAVYRTPLLHSVFVCSVCDIVNDSRQTEHGNSGRAVLILV